HNLADIVLEYIGCGMQSAQELLGKGRKKITMAEVSLADISSYCCKDSDAAFRLKSILENNLKQKDLYDLFCDIELPLVDVLADMEYSGVMLDIALLNKTSEYMAKEIERLQDEIYGLVGEEFNIKSPKQLSVVLFEKCKLPVVKKTKTGFSTDVDVLKKLSNQHPVPAKILEYREFSKLKSTYVDALPKLVNVNTGKVHTSFNQTVTATGRLSSSDPNLQNIPIKTEAGRRIRKAFISSYEKGLIVSADYSQIELRLLAHISGDKELLSAFKEDKDVHTHTASLIFDCKEDSVTKKMRQQAKIVNFGIVYGMSPYGLSKELGITADEAKSFIGSYFSRYPEVNKYIAQQISFAQDNGYVLTMLNRRRYIPEINSPNQNIRMFAERTAINTPIQGTAADLIKLAMIKIHSDIEQKALKSRMIMQVHDELVFDIPHSEKDELVQLVKRHMEGVVSLSVPIKVNIDVGKNWLE
ncbi:MAG: DNA polymerase I, partial [Candidatus Omnitrophota bacterium]